MGAIVIDAVLHIRLNIRTNKAPRCWDEDPITFKGSILTWAWAAVARRLQLKSPKIPK